MNGTSPAIALLIGVIGALVLMGGLSWLAVASIIRRRALPADRYRGPSVLVILAMIELGLPFLLVPPLLAFTGGDIETLSSPGALTLQLLITPLGFFALLAVFVAVPRALDGVRLWLGAASVRQAVIGLLAGLLVWSAAQVLAGVLVAILHLLGINPEGEQEVTAIAQQLPVPVAVLTIAVLAPIAEELFFRGFVFNAWEREYGTRRALIGATLLFGLAHVPGGPHEIIFVDDFSPNVTVWPSLLCIVEKNSKARALQLTRNFGQHAATLCGLAECRGDSLASLGHRRFGRVHAAFRIPCLFSRQRAPVVSRQVVDF